MVRKFEFHPRYKVEVSMYGSWFPATIIRRVSSNKFFVKYDHLNVRPAVVGVHQLRPVPRTVRDWEVKIGDKVEAFGKQRWREGHVSEVIGSTGKLFSVRFNDWKEMIVSKEKLRVHRKWINHNWVPRITNQQLKNNSKEFCKELKRARRANKRNMISKLPDCILLHIMSFLKARDAVRTCILSKRWKDLCKRLPTLTYIPSSAQSFKNFSSWVRSSRDHSCSLLNLTIENYYINGSESDLYTLLQYVLSHNLQHLNIMINPSITPKYEFLPLIFGSHSLTFLELSLVNGYAKCPKSLHLPALRTLHLKCFNFVTTHYHCADPFSNCHVLNTLQLKYCSLIDDAQILCISNQTLSNLTISYVLADQFSLSTPNLSFFTISECAIFRQLLSSTCNLSFLQQVNIDYFSGGDGKASIFLKWLQVLANVEILKVDNGVIQEILREWRSNPISKKAQPPCFSRLKSFIVHRSLNASVPVRQVDIFEVADYLLQNTTPMPSVEIIRGNLYILRPGRFPCRLPMMKLVQCSYGTNTTITGFL
ncbi:F-box/FBD/LRR-repeat protein At5g53840 [Medicago truncatula]|uniref:F-box/FBD/LRR-repeat protein At5g53840 n=1 Tax=Medicago truncatula TaxID=3880 RepID=UPI000D2F1F9F|nr:F-box/FBD/LRR-repeat protein At5g53840-like [Medicago truncatula]